MTVLPFIEQQITTSGDASATRRLRWSMAGLRPIVLPLLFFLLWLGGWEWVVDHFPASRSVLASPSEIAAVLVKSFPLLVPHIVSTACDTLLGFALAVVVGVALGGALAQFHRLNQALFPHLVLFQIVPKIALAPLFVIWLGVGTESRLVFALFLSFFPIAAATAAGLSSTRPEALRLCAALNAPRWRTFLCVRVPFAIPALFAGLKMGMTMALIGTIVGEFVTGQEGLGYVVMFAAAGADNALTFAALALLCAVGLLIYGAVVLAEVVTQRWYGAPFVTEGFN